MTFLIPTPIAMLHPRTILIALAAAIIGFGSGIFISSINSQIDPTETETILQENDSLCEQIKLLEEKVIAQKAQLDECNAVIEIPKDDK